MQTKEKNKHQNTVIKLLICAGIPAVLLTVFYIFSGIRPFANAVVKHFSRPVKDILGTVFSFIPFSVMELMYVAAGIFVICFIIRTVKLAKHSEKRLKTVMRRVSMLALVIIYIFTAFQWIFGIDYHADSFEDKSGIDIDGISADELYAVTKYFITMSLATQGNVARSSEGLFAADMDSYIKESPHIYDNLIKEFPFLDCRSRAPKKMYLFSKVSSYMGFTGVFFPFTGESNINIDAPGCLIPFTIAHELAHQRSVYAEQEANFLGIAACVSSGNNVYEYSGYLAGSRYLLNALYKADRDAWLELRKMISGYMLIDWVDNNEYWARYETPVTTVSEAVYDGYLKANGQHMGISSYGACVDLLVTYFSDIANEFDYDVIGVVS